MDTLEYLAKGGRIGKAANWAGSLLNIKPILEVSNVTGSVEPIQRVRSKSKAVDRLLEIVGVRVQGKGPLHVIVDHSDALPEAEDLKQRVMASFDCREIYISDITPACGVNLWPGVVGVSFYPEG
jgi:DegV family protein with EDD domain